MEGQFFTPIPYHIIHSAVLLRVAKLSTEQVISNSRNHEAQLQSLFSH
jgi:hypothetical protein